MFEELRLVLPPDSRPSEMALSIWRAGITPWSWAMQCGPDFLPVHSMGQLVTWAAMDAYRKLEHDQYLAAAFERADQLLRAQGFVPNPEPVEEHPRAE